MIRCGFVSLRVSAEIVLFFFFLMIRRPPRSTLDRSSAASDVYKRQARRHSRGAPRASAGTAPRSERSAVSPGEGDGLAPVSYTHLRAHETVLDLVCRLLLEKKKMKPVTTANTRAVATARDYLH